MRWIVIISFYCVLFGWGFQVHAHGDKGAVPVVSSSAPTIAVGFGPSFGGVIGGQLGFTAQLPNFPARLTPFFGLGYNIALNSREGSGGETHVGLAGGLGLSFGIQHRALLEVAYGVLTRAQATLHGTVVASRNLYGFLFTGGYEYLFRWGLYGRVQIGAGTIIDGPPLFDQNWMVVSNVALGYKLW